MAAIAVLGLVALALVACIAWDGRCQRAERKELLDRIQAPEAAQLSAFRLPGPEGAQAPEDQFTEPVARSDDLLIDDLMGVK